MNVLYAILAFVLYAIPVGFLAHHFFAARRPTSSLPCNDYYTDERREDNLPYVCPSCESDICEMTADQCAEAMCRAYEELHEDCPWCHHEHHSALCPAIATPEQPFEQPFTGVNREDLVTTLCLCDPDFEYLRYQHYLQLRLRIQSERPR